jgi:hypothetical protein
MKKLMLLFTAFLFVTGSFAASVINPEIPKLKASDIFIPVGNNGKTISFMELSAISTKDFQFLTGEKMNFFERLSFNLSQKKLKKVINADGTIDNKKFEKLKFGENDKAGFRGGFFLGLILSVFGVLICPLNSATHKGDSYKRSKLNGVWIVLIGCGIVVLIGLLVLL